METTRVARTRIRAALRDGMTTVFQPIADVCTGRVVGFESLARFADAPERPVEDWFAEAGRVGMRKDLELAAVRHALDRLDDIPEGTYLSINASPDVVASEEFAQALAEVPAGKVLVEMTEDAPVADHEKLAAAVKRLRDRGVRLAIDDAGAGFASLSLVLRLRPEVIKLDKSLTRGLDADPRRQALVAALAGFAASTSSTIIAEGIETEEELEAVRTLAVRWGQGFHLARPAPEPAAVALAAVRGRRRVVGLRGHGAARQRWGSRALRPASILIAAAVVWPAGAAAVMGLRDNAPTPVERVAEAAPPTAPAAPSTPSVPSPAAAPVQTAVVLASKPLPPVANPSLAPTAPSSTEVVGAVVGTVGGVVETVGGTVGVVEDAAETLTDTTSLLLRRVLRRLLGRRG